MSRRGSACGGGGSVPARGRRGRRSGQRRSGEESELFPSSRDYRCFGDARRNCRREAPLQGGRRRGRRGRRRRLGRERGRRRSRRRRRRSSGNSSSRLGLLRLWPSRGCRGLLGCLPLGARCPRRRGSALLLLLRRRRRRGARNARADCRRFDREHRRRKRRRRRRSGICLGQDASGLEGRRAPRGAPRRRGRRRRRRRGRRRHGRRRRCGGLPLDAAGESPLLLLHGVAAPFARLVGSSSSPLSLLSFLPGSGGRAAAPRCGARRARALLSAVAGCDGTSRSPRWRLLQAVSEASRLAHPLAHAHEAPAGLAGRYEGGRSGSSSAPGSGSGSGSGGGAVVLVAAASRCRRRRSRFFSSCFGRFRGLGAFLLEPRAVHLGRSWKPRPRGWGVEKEGESGNEGQSFFFLAVLK